MVYAYECSDGDFVGTPQESEGDAWGEGVEHSNGTWHEHGEVKESSG